MFDKELVALGQALEEEFPVVKVEYFRTCVVVKEPNGRTTYGDFFLADGQLVCSFHKHFKQRHKVEAFLKNLVK